MDVKVVTGAAGSVNVGAPKLTFSCWGTSSPGDQPRRVFAQIVDGRAGLVTGNQITSIAMNLDGPLTEYATAELEIIAFTTHPDSHLSLPLVATPLPMPNIVLAPRLYSTASRSNCRRRPA